jgi:hypothetical protein
VGVLCGAFLAMAVPVGDPSSVDRAVLNGEMGRDAVGYRAVHSQRSTVDSRQCKPEVPSRKRDWDRLIGVGAVRSQDLLCGAEDALFEKWAGTPHPTACGGHPLPQRGEGCGLLELVDRPRGSFPPRGQGLRASRSEDLVCGVKDTLRGTLADG